MFYRLAKIFFSIRSARIRLFALIGAYMLHRRWYGIFLDPVMACNLRCKMCYFSDESKRPAPVPPMSRDYIALLEKSIFPKALKLQIGCSAEPTLYKDLPYLIARAKSTGIPYVEITTNGQLLDADALRTLAQAGLDGLTLSLHGTTKDTYEHLMGNASYPLLHRLIKAIDLVKKEFPNFQLRVNYTFNNLNVAEMGIIPDIFEPVHIDVLQIRPIQNLGDTAYSDFSLDDIAARYDQLIRPLAEKCRRNGTLFIAPTHENLLAVDKQQGVVDAEIERFTYCYVSPDSCYRPDFNPASDTMQSYHRRQHTLRHLLGVLFSPRRVTTVDVTKKMNYTIN